MSRGVFDKAPQAGQRLDAAANPLAVGRVFVPQEPNALVVRQMSAAVGEDSTENLAVAEPGVAGEVGFATELDVEARQRPREGVIVEGLGVGDDAVEVEDDGLGHGAHAIRVSPGGKV